jgi:hypothetical protein
MPYTGYRRGELAFHTCLLDDNDDHRLSSIGHWMVCGRLRNALLAVDARTLTWSSASASRGVRCAVSVRGLSTVRRTQPKIAIDSPQTPYNRPRVARFCSFHNSHPVLSAMSSETPAKSADAYRLPTNVKPTHYDITLRTDLKEETFGGAVKIKYVLFSALDNCL